jgi:hypothetical protein
MITGSITYGLKGAARMLPAVAALLAFASFAQAGEGQRSGTFSGASGHSTSGSVTVTETAGAATLQLSSNFSLDGAPDPWIGFGKDGRFVAATRFVALGSHTGAQTYTVPSSVDLDAVNEVYIWCHKFSVPLGVARIR